MTGGNLKKRIEEIMANHEKPGLSPSKKFLLAAGGLMAVAIPVMVGMSNTQLKAQTSAEPGTDVLAWQRAAGGRMAFEEASVQNGPPFSLPSFPLDSGDAYVAKGGRFSADFPVAAYITFAYKISPTNAQQESMFAHWPKWVTTEPFEIQAKAAGNPTKDQVRLMMQSLLSDRFRLAVHYETHVVPVFALTLNQSGKLGPNIRPHDDSYPCDTGWPPSPLTADVNALPGLCGSVAMGSGPSNRTRLGARKITMAQLAAALPANVHLNRPVIDRTGLSGNFDVTIEWTFENVVVAPFRAEPDLPGPLFLNALREQMGLNLESTEAPVQILVIDNIDRPVEN
jgi:bla regulator protein blaR1